MRRIKLVALMVTGLLLLTGCEPNLQNLANFPEKYQNKNVTVTGEVSSKMELPQAHAHFYSISDASGQMWVVTQDQPPAIGEVITLKARFKTSVTLEGQNFPFLLIQESLTKASSGAETKTEE